MFQLYYISTAIDGLTPEDHEDILAKARKNNEALGVTGLLIVKGNHFAQVLEGEKENVMQLFEKIKLDKRHYRVVIISQTQIETRVFSHWKMGFRDVNTAPELLSEVDFSDPKYVDAPENLDKVFRKFVEFQNA